MDARSQPAVLAWLACRRLECSGVANGSPAQGGGRALDPGWPRVAPPPHHPGTLHSRGLAPSTSRVLSWIGSCLEGLQNGDDGSSGSSAWLAIELLLGALAGVLATLVWQRRSSFSAAPHCRLRGGPRAGRGCRRVAGPPDARSPTADPGRQRSRRGHDRRPWCRPSRGRAASFVKWTPSRGYPNHR